jgi:Skp family chaperone for outer membrane proteins
MKFIRPSMTPVSLALLLFAGSLAGRAAAQAPAPTPSRLAVINIQKAFQNLHQKQDGDAAIAKFIANFNTQKHNMETDMQKRLDDLNSNTGLFKKDSPEYNEQVNDLKKQRIAYKVFLATSQEDLESMELLKTTEVYRALNQAIQKYAEAHGIAIVFVQDDTDFTSAKTVEGLQAGIANRKIMYAHPDYDITDKVVEAMNAEYQPAPAK